MTVDEDNSKTTKEESLRERDNRDSWWHEQPIQSTRPSKEE